MPLRVRFSPLLPSFSLWVCARERACRRRLGSQQPRAKPAASPAAQSRTTRRTNYGTYCRRSAGQGALRQPLRRVAGLGVRPHEGGPTLLQGSNLGGLDAEGSYWLTQELGNRGFGPRVCGHQRHRRPTPPNDIKGPDGEAVFLCGRRGVAGAAQQARGD